MAIFGSLRDISTFKGITRELVENVVSQQVGYYKYQLNDTTVNVYGEGIARYYIGPVLINCLIERGDFNTTLKDQVLDIDRSATFRFFRDHLIDANIVCEVGDILMYNESYYAVDNVNENQLILGKDNDYSYSSGLENFGNSYSVILTTHYTSADRIGIKQERL
jgi:hypothetical protein